MLLVDYLLARMAGTCHLHVAVRWLYPLLHILDVLTRWSGNNVRLLQVRMPSRTGNNSHMRLRDRLATLSVY